jgi:hypothetical protein
MPGVHDRIVVNHDNPVAGRVHVDLNAIGRKLDGALKRRDRILRMGLVRAPVGDPLGRIAASTCGQVFLVSSFVLDEREAYECNWTGSISLNSRWAGASTG